MWTLGTGTQVGDKAEASAFAQIFTLNRPKCCPLYVGSVKTNVGHTEAAAGLSGLLKSVLVLENGMIPQNLNFASANKDIPLDQWQITVRCYPIKIGIIEFDVQIPNALIRWPEGRPRRASVNSFGYGGTNVHVILDCPEEYQALHCPRQDVRSKTLRDPPFMREELASVSRLQRTSNGNSLKCDASQSGETTGQVNKQTIEPDFGEPKPEIRRVFVLSHGHEQGKAFSLLSKLVRATNIS